jgi:AcrR family transcriptional regulator
VTSGTSGSKLEQVRSEVAAHRHGRVPRELRVRQLLAVAEDLFAERGYAGASMDELAARAGVSKPVVYDLVGAKEAVFATCMTAAADELAERVARSVAAAGDDPAARLRAGALAWFEFVGERRSVWDGLLATPDAPVTEAIDRIRERQDAWVAAELVRAAEDAGGPADGALASAVAAAMNGAFEALARWWHAHPDRTAVELADLYTALLLPGLAALALPPGAGR